MASKRTRTSSDGLSHLDARGHARMVDVAEKEITRREATAEAFVLMAKTTFDAIKDGRVPKGDVIATARIAGIMAAKRTPELIPLCHPLALTRVAVDFDVPDASDEVTASVHCTATAETVGPTGVEMEALTAVQVALLTLYDMCKAVDRGMTISDVRVREKHGGKSGSFVNP